MDFLEMKKTPFNLVQGSMSLKSVQPTPSLSSGSSHQAFALPVHRSWSRRLPTESLEWLRRPKLGHRFEKDVLHPILQCSTTRLVEPMLQRSWRTNRLTKRGFRLHLIVVTNESKLLLIRGEHVNDGGPRSRCPQTSHVVDWQTIRPQAATPSCKFRWGLASDNVESEGKSQDQERSGLKGKHQDY